jgi:hypothetical protein
MKVIVIAHQEYDLYWVSCVLKETDLDMYIEKYREFMIGEINKNTFNIDRNIVYTESDITTLVNENSVYFQYDIPEYTVAGYNIKYPASKGGNGFNYTIHEIGELNFTY